MSEFSVRIIITKICLSRFVGIKEILEEVEIKKPCPRAFIAEMIVCKKSPDRM